MTKSPRGRAQMISFACSGCGRQLRVTPDRAGKLAKCPRCTLLTRIPAGSADGAVPPLAEPLPAPAVPPAGDEAATLAPLPQPGSAGAPGDPAETVTFPAGDRDAPAPAGLIGVPGYEILGELGRGG